MTTRRSLLRYASGVGAGMALSHLGLRHAEAELSGRWGVQLCSAHLASLKS